MEEIIGGPEPPLHRLITEGTVGDCPKCGSTTLKRRKPGTFGLFQRKTNIGCIQPRCSNYHESKKNKRDWKLEQLGI